MRTQKECEFQGLITDVNNYETCRGPGPRRGTTSLSSLFFRDALVEQQYLCFQEMSVISWKDSPLGTGGVCFLNSAMLYPCLKADLRCGNVQGV